MNYFFTYDISHNRLRTKASKTLERFGCIRVQKSVFFASELRIEDKKQLCQKLQELLEEQEDDSIMLIPVDKDYLQEITLVGKNEAYQEALIDIKTMVI